ncbi:MAG: hypothetical protein IPL39_17010 [Opitutaceae bacterium]|nr:hypothetical protein [Opitutaceae bacterium]
MKRLRQVAVVLFVLGVAANAHAIPITPAKVHFERVVMILITPIAFKGAILALFAPCQPRIPALLRAFGIAFVGTSIWLQLAVSFPADSFDVAALVCALPIITSEVYLLHWLSNKYDTKPASWLSCIFSNLAASMLAYYMGMVKAEHFEAMMRM